MVFDESASWYALPTPTPGSIPITEDKASEPETVREEEEKDFGTLEESLVSFWLSGQNERQSPNDQSDEELVSSGDAVLQFEETVVTQGKGKEEDVGVRHQRPKPRRLLTRKEKEKKKMLEYGTDEEESDETNTTSERMQMDLQRRSLSRSRGP